MKISLNWIKNYIHGLESSDINELKEKMISAGLDIENIESESDIYKNFVVGEVLEKIKHPNAEKLSLCKVNIGEEILNIVCGASNVDTGQKVCVAKTGAIIPNGGFEIKKTKIRGQISEGMICSDSELNISDNHDGIKVLDNGAVPGQMLSDHLGFNDVLIEIGITPNRGDLLSHFGIAREIASIYDRKIIIPETDIKESDFTTEDCIEIEIEKNSLCRRFTGRVIKNVVIKESPLWLKNRLTAIGLRPRNNIVDITNFVMFETGQPLHAFDYDKIRGKKIIVKNAKEADKFITLDSKERTLNSDSIMVCDTEGYLGIGGVMGGEFSEITENTKNVFLESAYFDPLSIRKNSKRLGLMTDASYRFERGVDIEMVEYASKRATQLISELAGGEVSKEMLDVYPGKRDKLIVPMRVWKSNELTGLKLTEDEAINLLFKIDISFLKQTDDILYFEIPEFRRLDIEREADLIEELARVYGYENIPEETKFSIHVSNPTDTGRKEIRVNKFITDHLIGRGFNQVLTNSLTDSRIPERQNEKYIHLKNSVSSEMNALRTNLIYELMNSVRNNFFHSGKDLSIKFFEIGKVFNDTGSSFEENERLIMILSGKYDSENFYGGDRQFDIFDIKGETEMLLSKLNLENFRLIYYNNKDFNGIKTDISLNGEVIGNINKADSGLRKEFEIENDIYFAEFFLEKIYDKVSFSKYYNQISKFPAVKRDLAIVVDENVKYDEIKESVYKSTGQLLKGFELFDLYHDEKLGQNKKSMAFSLEFNSHEKTLTDDETGIVMYKITKDLEKKFDAKLR